MKRFHIDSTVRVKLTREGEHYFKQVWQGREYILDDGFNSIQNPPTVMQTAIQVADMQRRRRFNEPVNGMIDLTLREFLMVFEGSSQRHDSDLSRTIEEWFIIDPKDLVDVDSLGHQDLVQLELPPSEVSDIVGYLYQLEDDTGSDTEYLRGIFEDAMEEHANLN